MTSRPRLMRSAANSLEQCVLFLPGTFVRFGVFWWVAAASSVKKLFADRLRDLAFDSDKGGSRS